MTAPKGMTLARRIRALFVVSGWEHHHLDKRDLKGKTVEQIQALRQQSYANGGR